MEMEALNERVAMLKARLKNAKKNEMPGLLIMDLKSLLKNAKSRIRSIEKNQSNEAEEGEEKMAEGSDGTPLYILDTKPTKVAPPILAAADETTTEAVPPVQDGDTLLTGKLKRKERRRLELCEKEKKRIQKRLGVAEDVANEEVERQLQDYMEKYDRKERERQKRKEKRAIALDQKKQRQRLNKKRRD